MSSASRRAATHACAVSARVPARVPAQGRGTHRALPALPALAVLLLAAALGGCAGQPASDPPDDAAAAPDERVAPDSLRDDLVQHGLAVPTGGRAEVRAALGPPDSTHARAVPNRHVPARTDTIVELFHPGLRLEYRVVGGDETADLLSVADVRENRYLAYPELGVGASVAELTRRLGAPQERTDRVLRYHCGSCMGAESPVEFHVADGRVRRVRFTFYVD